MSQTNFPLPLIEMLVSRICHDMISPIGAIYNGLELLEEGEMVEDATELMKGSVELAKTRLKLCRMMYGLGGYDPDFYLRHVEELVGDLLRNNKKISYIFENEMDADLPKSFIKLALAFMLLAIDLIPRGGSIVLKAEDDKLTVTLQAESFHMFDESMQAFQNELDQDDITPKLIHPYMLGHIARYHDVDIHHIKEGDRIIFQAAFT